ncbi:MAG TPA: hypothetical protein VE907_12275 [Gammaproteobacteria bacterium]|nr:hypothetical protein [Gammaproteobacteria bacterium]
MTTAESIEHFCQYFERELQSIGRLIVAPVAAVDESEGGAFRYRKLLYVTDLDAMAKIRYEGKHYKNHKRFKLFVVEHGSWPEAELVSVPFLAAALKRCNRLGSVLGQHVSARLAQFATEDGGFPAAAMLDERTADLLTLARSKRDREAVERCRHIDVLYRYRNFLVHESREPGYGMDVTNSAESHYTSYIDDPLWHLVYPLPMFEALLRRSLASFRQWLTTNSVDPYSLIEEAERF